MLLILALPLNRLLGVHIPVAGPKHGAVLVLVVISPVAGLIHLLQMQGKTKRGPHTLQQCWRDNAHVTRLRTAALSTAGFLVQSRAMVESQRGEGDDDGLTDQLGQGPGGFQGAGLEGVLVLVD